MTEKRKAEHIELAEASRPQKIIDLEGMYYEPLFGNHIDKYPVTHFLGHDFKLPLWVSSMTGGEERAKQINTNLAKACDEFSLGMGLGSCRPLLKDSSRLSDFDVKEFMPNAPLYTNFGIAQLEELVQENTLSKIQKLTNSLHADGIIIHVNPLQEWAQLEGDKYKMSPIETIKEVLSKIDLPIIVKEVGQGFGPRSLEALTSLPLAAIELAGFGGTNFTILEHARENQLGLSKSSPLRSVGNIGHTCDEMIDWLNQLDLGAVECDQIIISGGVKDPVQAYKKMSKLQMNSIVGMASGFLNHAMGEYEDLQKYILEIESSLKVLNNFVK